MNYVYKLLMYFGAVIFILSASTTLSAQGDVRSNLENVLEQLVPGIEPDSIRPAVILGLYEVVIGPHVVYLSADGAYMIRGDIINIDTKDNLTENKRARARINAINSLGEASMVIFGPDNAEHTVTIFTDADCGYCRKLHWEINQYNNLGIKVRYLAFPRAGIGSDSYNTLVSVWCSSDRQKAMTAAKLGNKVEERDCFNPIEDHYTVGRLIGVNGTPTIVTTEGVVVTGYVPAKRLLNMLQSG